MPRNLVGVKNVDVIQRTIDVPPLRDQSIDGTDYRHDNIQYTSSLEKAGHAPYPLAALGGE